MKIQKRNRATLLAIVGAYLIYLAYEMMRDELAGKSTMQMWVCVLFTVLLGTAGIAVLVLALRVYRAKEPEETEGPEEPKTLK